MIKDTFELFREPFDKASVNRDYSLERDSTRASVAARFQYLAQVIVSLVSVPFLILAGLYDLASGDCNPFKIPVALFSQLFIILPISFFSMIAPMSCSRGIDKCLSNWTRERCLNNLELECLPYLNDELKRLHPDASRAIETIEIEDLQAAIRQKDKNLKEEMLKKTLRQIRDELLAAPRNSISQSNLYEMLKKKEEYLKTESRKTIDQLYLALRVSYGSDIQTLDELRAAFVATPAMIDTLAYHNTIDILALKRANGPETIEDLLGLQPEDPLERGVIHQTLIRKYVATHTVDVLEALSHAPDVTAPLIEAFVLKTQIVDTMATCEKLSDLPQPPPAERNNPNRVDLYTKAYTKKLTFLEQLQDVNSFETLRANLANTRNPIQQSDLKEAIIDKYLKNNSYYDLKRLVDQTAPAAVDPLLLSALRRGEQEINNLVSHSTVAELEQGLLETVPDQNDSNLSDHVPVHQHQHWMEALRRKYYRTNTVQELEAMMSAPDAEERPQVIKDAVTDALGLKKRDIQTLVNTKSFATLRGDLAREPDAIKQDLFDIAGKEKHTIITNLVDQFSLEQLNEQHHRSPAGKMPKSDLKEALDEKQKCLTQLVRDTSLSDLEAKLATTPEEQTVTKADLTYAIQEKKRHIAAAANPPPAGAQQQAGATGAGGADAIPPAPGSGETAGGPAGGAEDLPS